MNVGALIGRRVLILLLAIAVAAAAWQLLVLEVSPLVSRTPVKVVEYLGAIVGTPEGATLWSAALETLRDFSIGIAGGLTASFALAILFCVSLTVERIMMPTTMLLRTIPVIVVAPLITLVFGIGAAGVAAITIVVVFFPSLAVMLLGLRDAQAEYGDLFRAYRGSTVAMLRKAAIPGALPSVMAAARLAVPASMTGAMIAEWLATGEGLGGYISRSVGSFGYDVVWAGAALVTVFTMVSYTAVDIVEAIVRRRYSLEQA